MAAWIIALIAGRLAAADSTNVTEEYFRLQQSMWPFEQPSRATLAASPKKVYAHRHLFPLSYDNRAPETDKYSSLQQPGGQQSSAAGGFLRTRSIARAPRPGSDWRIEDALWDMRLAQAIGVDGFWFNLSVGSFDNPDFWPALIDHLTAAERLGGGFTITPNLDFANGSKASGKELAGHLVDFLAQHGKLASPALQRVDGRLVISCFAGQRVSPEWWREFRAELTRRGQPPFIAFCTLSWEVANVAKYAGIADAYGDWGIRKDPDYDYDAPGHFGTIPAGKPAVAMVRGFDVRYKRGSGSYFESAGSKTLREHWLAAIKGGRVDWAQLVTWNDFGEDTGFRPNSTKQYAVYDLTAYYLAWFKTGQPPRITRDALYYFHRIQRTASAPPAGLIKAELRADSPPAQDIIELVVMLTAPGTVVVETGAGAFRQDVPAGVSSFVAPLPTGGRPVFRLERNSAKAIEIASAFAIGAAPGQDDMTYRAGGSIRTLYGQAHPAAKAAAKNAEASERAMGEPVWLAR